jgi:hypothetical protein
MKSKKSRPAAQSKPKSTVKAQTFAAGQKWQMQRGYAEIVQVGKTLVQYRFLKTGMVRGHLEMKSIPNFAEAMKANKAKLID